MGGGEGRGRGWLWPQRHFNGDQSRFARLGYKAQSAPCHACLSQEPTEGRAYCPYFTDEKTEAQGGQRLPRLWKQQSGELEAALMAGLGRGGGSYSHGALLLVARGRPAPEAGSTHQAPASDSCSLANSPV